MPSIGYYSRGVWQIILRPVGHPTALEKIWRGTSPAQPQQWVHDGWRCRHTLAYPQFFSAITVAARIVQVLATTAYKNDVHFLPQQLHKKVETLHYPALGAPLNVFAHEHAVGPRTRPVSKRHQLQCRELLHLPSAGRLPICLVGESCAAVPLRSGAVFLLDSSSAKSCYHSKFEH